MARRRRQRLLRGAGQELPLVPELLLYILHCLAAKFAVVGVPFFGDFFGGRSSGGPASRRYGDRRVGGAATKGLPRRRNEGERGRFGPDVELSQRGDAGVDGAPGSGDVVLGEVAAGEELVRRLERRVGVDGSLRG